MLPSLHASISLRHESQHRHYVTLPWSINRKQHTNDVIVHYQSNGTVLLYGLREIMINAHVVEGLTWKFGVESLALTETCPDTTFHVTVIELRFFKTKKKKNMDKMVFIWYKCSAVNSLKGKAISWCMRIQKPYIQGTVWTYECCYEPVRTVSQSMVIPCIL